MNSPPRNANGAGSGAEQESAVNGASAAGANANANNNAGAVGGAVGAVGAPAGSGNAPAIGAAAAAQQPKVVQTAFIHKLYKYVFFFLFLHFFCMLGLGAFWRGCGEWTGVERQRESWETAEENLELMFLL